MDLKYDGIIGQYWKQRPGREDPGREGVGCW